MNASIRIFTLCFSITCCIGTPAPFSGQETPPSLHTEMDRYQSDSEAAHQLLEDTLSTIKTASGVSKLLPPPPGKRVPAADKRERSWFLTAEGHAAVQNIMSFQGPNGGWSKNIDVVSQKRAPGMSFGESSRWISTFDNGATVPQIRIVSKSYSATRDPSERASALRGFDYIFRSQYPNGGWPQVYPLSGGYHDHITYNDGAMVSILELLLDVEQEHPSFAWLPDSYKKRCSEALQRGIECVLATQIHVEGKLTAWGQQHDRSSLAPVPARAFEMTSLTSGESARIVDFLIRIPNPSPEIVAAIEGACQWFEQTAISGYTFSQGEDGGRTLLPADPSNRLWARFYEIGTNRPLFGDRDNSIHYSVDEISMERRNGYGWYVTDPASTLNRVRKWQAKR